MLPGDSAWKQEPISLEKGSDLELCLVFAALIVFWQGGGHE